jgi:hypothetical protein
MMYVQCQLISGLSRDVRWIPEKLAVVSRILRVKETGRNWIVDKTYGRADEKQVIEMRDFHKHHRKGTDI